MLNIIESAETLSADWLDLEGFLQLKDMSMMVDQSEKSGELTHSDIEEMLWAVNGRIVGLDTDDNEYDSILPIWEKELSRSSAYEKKNPLSEAERSASEVVWYNKAFEYWESDANCPITDGESHH